MPFKICFHSAIGLIFLFEAAPFVLGPTQENTSVMCYFTMMKDTGSAPSHVWSGAMHLLPEYNDLNLAYLATEDWTVQT